MTFGRIAYPLVFVAAGTTVAHAEARIQIAAASDLAFVLPEIERLFEQATGQKLVFSFGSSGLLAHQIENGAPFDLFFSADVDFVDRLIRAGVCTAGSKHVYARGQLILYTPKGVAPPHRLSDLREPRFQKLAIARPEHAPYGRAAKEALLNAGLWSALLPRLVYGENIQQTLAFAESGNVEAALVANSLLTMVSGERLPIDAALYRPILQALVLCGDREKHKQAARAFAAFVTSPAGRAVLMRHGFSPPPTP